MKSCVKKIYSFDDAIEELKELVRRSRTRKWDMYYCEKCGGYHVVRVS
jgi:hypothetical protein